jgi:hypothetical protein
MEFFTTGFKDFVEILYLIISLKFAMYFPFSAVLTDNNDYWRSTIDIYMYSSTMNRYLYFC